MFNCWQTHIFRVSKFPSDRQHNKWNCKIQYDAQWPQGSHDDFSFCRLYLSNPLCNIMQAQWFGASAERNMFFPIWKFCCAVLMFSDGLMVGTIGLVWSAFHGEWSLILAEFLAMLGMYALAMETARSLAKPFRLVKWWPFWAMDWTRLTLRLKLCVSDFTDQNSVNMRLRLKWHSGVPKKNPHIKLLLWDKLMHFSCDVAVPFAGDLREDFQNSKPLNSKTRNHWIKTVFFTFQVFFFMMRKPSFDTSRFKINIRGGSVISGNHDPEVTRDRNDGTRDERETKGPILTGRWTPLTQVVYCSESCLKNLNSESDKLIFLMSLFIKNWLVSCRDLPFLI